MSYSSVLGHLISVSNYEMNVSTCKNHISIKSVLFVQDGKQIGSLKKNFTIILVDSFRD